MRNAGSTVLAFHSESQSGFWDHIEMSFNLGPRSAKTFDDVQQMFKAALTN